MTSLAEIDSADQARAPVGRSSILSERIAVAALAGAAALLSLAANSSGIGVSADSTVYLSAAENLASGSGLSSYTLDPVTNFPPGLPILLSIPLLLGMNSEAAAVLVNALLAASIAATVWLATRSIVDRPWLRLAGAGFVVFAAPMTLIHRWVWSEPGFTLIAVVLAVALSAAPRDDAARTRWLVLLGAIASAGFLFRYAGIGLVIGVALVLMLQKCPARLRMRDTVLFGIASAPVPALWVTRNLVSTGDFGGPGAEARGSFTGDLGTVLAEIGGWAIPVAGVPRSASIVIGGVLLALLCCGTWYAFRGDRLDTRRRDIVVSALGLAVGLTAYMLAMARIRWVEFDARMMAPTLPLVLLASLVIVDALLRRAHPGLNKTAIGLTLAVIIPMAGLATRAAYLSSSDGRGANIEAFRSSALIEASRDLPDDALLVSNRAGLLWFHTDRQPILDQFPEAAEIDQCQMYFFVRFDIDDNDGATSASDTAGVVVFDGAEGQITRIDPTGSNCLTN